MNPPTYRDIAKKAGVSVATISFALGSNPKKVSASTRERIGRIAREMGYRPNPMLSAWQSQVRSRRATPIRAALAWINDHPDPDWWKINLFHHAVRQGAIRRARELGYRMDDVWVPGSADLSPESYVNQCLSILRARGITGVLLPHMDYAACAEVDWADCTVVVIGKPERMSQYLHQSRHHQSARQHMIHHEVNPDFFRNATLAYQRLAATGYSRIGLAISVNHDMESDQLISSAFENENRQKPAARRVPIFRHEDQYDLSGLGPWIRKHRPDAILAVLSQTKPELDRLGIRIPEEIGLAHMNLKFDVPGWSGINRHSDIIGASAVDLLTSCLQRNETGIPAHPKEVLIKGSWVDGKTTRVQ